MVNGRFRFTEPLEQMHRAVFSLARQRRALDAGRDLFQAAMLMTRVDGLRMAAMQVRMVMLMKTTLAGLSRALGGSDGDIFLLDNAELRRRDAGAKHPVLAYLAQLHGQAAERRA